MQPSTADVIVLAMGGQYGHGWVPTGAWALPLRDARCLISPPFAPANAGFIAMKCVSGISGRTSGAALERHWFEIRNLTVPGGRRLSSATGLEGGGIYTVFARLAPKGHPLMLDLLARFQTRETLAEKLR